MIDPGMYNSPEQPDSFKIRKKGKTYQGITGSTNFKAMLLLKTPK